MNGPSRARVFDDLSLLAEPLRVRLLRLLAREELGVGELASIVQTPQSTVSRHLKALLDGGWVARRTEGTSSLVRLAALPPDAARLWALVCDDTDGQAVFEHDLERMRDLLARRQVDSRAYFGRVAARWGEVRRELFGEGVTVPALLSLLPPGWTVADLGCGTGEAVAALAPVVRRVIAVDQEQAMLDATAARVAGAANVDLRAGDLRALPLADGEADAALLMLVLHHVEDVAGALREARRAVRPGGPVVWLDMVAHDRDVYRHTMGHVHLGFGEPAVHAAAAAAKLHVASLRVLPADPDAQGPPLFVAVLRA